MSSPLPALDRGGDIPKLSIAVGMLTAFLRLDVALKGVAQLVQQLGDDRVADRVAQGLQRDGQRPGTFAGPSQRRVRIAGRRWLDQGVEITQQRWIENRRGFPAAPRPAGSSRRYGRASLEFAQAALNRRPRNAGRAFDYVDAADVPRRALRSGLSPWRCLAFADRACADRNCCALVEVGIDFSLTPLTFGVSSADAPGIARVV